MKTETLKAPHTEAPTEGKPSTQQTAKGAILAVETPRIIAARTALAGLLGAAALLRNNAAKLAVAANEAFKAVNVAEVAKHYATIAVEIFAALPATRTGARTWASAWQFQMSQLAIAVFGETEGDKAADLRSRFGVDASKYGLVFFYCQDVLPHWVGDLYGVQPKSYPTLAQAYEIARNLKNLARPKTNDALAKLWGSVTKKLPTLDEMERFVLTAQRDLAARKMATQEAPAPQQQVA